MMKKTFLITTLIVAFCCFSCDDEPIDFDVEVLNPTPTNPTDPTDPSDPTDPTDPTNPTTGSLSVYTYDLTTNAPIFGEIITDTDFNIQNGVVTSANIDITTFGVMVNSLSTFTRDGNGNITMVEDNAGGMPSNRTTITYSGNNISQIQYEFFEDPTENYTFDFTYSGNTVEKTVAGTTLTATYTFDAGTSRITQVAWFDGGTSISTETFVYAANGNCTSSTLEENGTTEIHSYTFDTFTNPLKAVFADQYLLSIFNTEEGDHIGGTLANFHGENNWIAGSTPQGTFDFNPQYNADNKIISKGGNYDLGDGVTVDQSEAYQY